MTVIQLFERRPDPDEMISMAAQEHMAVVLAEFAEAAIEHIHRNKRPLNGLVTLKLIDAVDKIRGPS